MDLSLNDSLEFLLKLKIKEKGEFIASSNNPLPWPHHEKGVVFAINQIIKNKIKRKFDVIKLKEPIEDNRNNPVIVMCDLSEEEKGYIEGLTNEYILTNKL